MKTPFFSIIIPTYNREAFILETLQSFVNQEYENFEIIVVDDGGTDNTKEVVSTLDDHRIKYYWKENEERAIARNFGANKATGKYLNFFDSDDIAYPKHLYVAKEVIDEHDNPNVFHLGFELGTRERKIIRRTHNLGDKGKMKLFEYCYLNPNSVFVKKSVWEEVKFKEERNLIVSEDWLFFLQLSMRYEWMVKDSIITSLIVQHEDRSLNLISGDDCYSLAFGVREAIKNDPFSSERLPEIAKKKYLPNLKIFRLYVMQLRKKRLEVLQHYCIAVH